jgi:histidinol dehydrogenase
MAGTQRLMRLLRTRDVGFEAEFRQLEERRQARAEEIQSVVAEIVEDVRRRGDAGLLDAVERYDGYRLRPDQLVVSSEEIEGASARLPAQDRDALETAAGRIRRFHSRAVPSGWMEDDAGEILGQLVRPLARVGLYVPGFTAPLASSVLMLGIPAAVAGVRELVMVCPGLELHPAVLEAARLAGVTQLLRVGGAQAIAALAYGTQTLRRVDKIVGPGNAYVQAAKRQVFGEVAIDAEAGPSEVLIVADASAPATLVAADLLAQAEHDEMASVVLATPSESLVQTTLDELAKQIAELPREAVARRALSQRSALVVTRDLEQAMELANRYAAEHLQLMVEDPARWLDRVENAGAVFLGPHSPVPLGDYVAGPSHVLPTGGTARFFSVVGVEDFLKRMSVIGFSEQALQRLGAVAVRLAELEGLDAHARAVRRRLEGPGAAEGLDPDS